MGKTRYKRVSGIRDVRPLFLVATEGKKTEPEYLNMRIFKPPETSIKTKVLPTRSSSSPISVLKRMKKYIKDYELGERDQIWLVIDRDQWSEEDLNALYSWTILADNRNLAVSNPRFEYWLLLHFEEGYGVNSPSECTDRLKCHCPDFSKSYVPARRFTRENVGKAIRRAKIKDKPPCEKWPIEYGTTVYRMVERIIQ